MVRVVWFTDILILNTIYVDDTLRTILCSYLGNGGYRHTLKDSGGQCISMWIFYLGYNYMAVAWQRNLATTTANLENYSNKKSLRGWGGGGGGVTLLPMFRIAVFP